MLSKLPLSDLQSPKRQIHLMFFHQHDGLSDLSFSTVHLGLALFKLETGKNPHCLSSVLFYAGSQMNILLKAAQEYIGA